MSAVNVRVHAALIGHAPAKQAHGQPIATARLNRPQATGSPRS
jgi:hypothetical protein